MSSPCGVSLGPVVPVKAALEGLPKSQALLDVMHAQLVSMNAQLVANYIELEDKLKYLTAGWQPLTSIHRARQANNHELDIPLVPVLHPNGTYPPHWPAAGLRRRDLSQGTIVVVDNLLRDYCKPAGPRAGTLTVRRAALAEILGTKPL